jgi:hypothetical protein
VFLKWVETPSRFLLLLLGVLPRAIGVSLQAQSLWKALVSVQLLALRWSLSDHQGAQESRTSDIMVDISYISVSNNVRAFVLYQRKFVHARVLEALWASIVEGREGRLVTIGRKPLSARVARVRRGRTGSLVVCRSIIVGPVANCTPELGHGQ